MPANIEIKARARAPERQRRLAVALSDFPEQRLEQTDTYFNAPRGRLKLREYEGTGELIYYQRPDQNGPKRSDYLRPTIDRPAELKTLLTAALGVRGVVRKTRWLSLRGPTRIHFDEVNGLGCFIELEVVLAQEQTDAQGAAVAADLMRRLEIEPADLIEGSYIDLLTAEVDSDSTAARPSLAR